MALREVSLRAKEVESSLREANVRLEGVDAELSRECGATEELQKMLSQTEEAKRTAGEAKSAAEARMRELSLACDGFVTTSTKAVFVLSKVEHRALGVLPGGRQGVRQPFAPSSDQGASCRLATGATGHVERVIAKGAFYGSGWPWGRWSLILMRSMLP